ncbi:MAG TPA: hypothetical protein VK806_14360 [Bacteroidia bacterium]|jgi:hypothetical protein|nr:hypothetical protein [Bacteroidia bacterium]
MLKKRNTIMLIGLAVALILMLFTNPSKESFQSYATKDLISRGFDSAFVRKNLSCNRSRNVYILSKFYLYINDSGVTLQGDYIGVFGFFIPIRVITVNQ